MAAAIAALAAAFVIPHGSAGNRGIPPVQRWLGRLDGGARLTVVAGAEGTRAWQSATSRLLPDDALLAYPAAVARTIAGREAEPGESDLYLIETVDRPVDGPSVRSGELAVLDRDGYGLAATINPDGNVTAFEPTVPVLPRDPKPGSSWRSHGDYGDTATYRYQAKVVDERRLDPGPGGTVDCLEVESELRLDAPGVPSSTTRSVETWCEGVGSSAVLEGEGEAAVTTKLASVAGTRPTAEPGPVDGLASSEGSSPMLGGDGWQRTVVSAPGAGVGVGGPSALPVVVDAERPMVLTATLGSPSLESTGIDAGGATPAWSAAMGEVTFGAPLVDRAGGRVFAGSAAGEVRAFGIDGLFLWAVDVGDKVSVRPVLAADTLVVGSDDGTVVGLNPDSGSTRWTVETGGPVASWPAASGALVVVGSDDGVVRGIDAKRGDVEWTYEASGPVTSPVVAVDGSFLVTDLAGGVALLDAQGKERWVTELDAGIETEPAVHGDQFVVVAAGDLIAMDLKGRQRWRRPGDHVGPVAVIDGSAAVVAATEAGSLLALDGDGRLVEQWTPPSGGASAEVTVGPVVGAGAVWLVDGAGRLERLGPALSDAEQLEGRWVATIGDSSLGDGTVVTSAVASAGSVYLLDSGGEIFQVGAEGPTSTGSVALPGPEGIGVGWVSDGDYGYAVAGSTAISFSLPNGNVRWERPLEGSVLRPPQVSDGTLVVATATEVGHEVTAIDVADGEVRWSAAVGTASFPGIVAGPLLVVDELVVAGDPVQARSLDDGSLRWTSEWFGSLGGAAPLSDGTIAVTGIDPSGDPDQLGTSVGALSLADGDVIGSALAPGVLPSGLADVVVVDDQVVLSDIEGLRVVAVDPVASGPPTWDIELPDQVLGGPGAADDGRVWVALVDGRVLALDAERGEIVAQSAPIGVDLADLSFGQHPLVVGDTVVVAGGLAAFAVAAGAPG